ncbi:MAG TPA: YkgJ family cysteine cluster protein [Capsulimonadaceae bacterium]|nr:YkgJ family cysteine cluster protein [Capsulimonadaceae bacterium]
MPRESTQPGQIIREIPLIARYSRHNENNDYRFRTFLKAELDLSNRDLDAVVQEITDEVWKQIDCTTCANCCKTLQIVVDDADIRRLAAKLGMSFAAFSKKYVCVDPDKTKYFASTPCAFLGADNRCTVYEDRPQACRDFPYLHTTGFRQRTFMMIDNRATCLIVFNVWQRLKARLWRRRR